MGYSELGGGGDRENKVFKKKRKRRGIGAEEEEKEKEKRDGSEAKPNGENVSGIECVQRYRACT